MLKHPEMFDVFLWCVRHEHPYTKSRWYHHYTEKELNLIRVILKSNVDLETGNRITTNHPLSEINLFQNKMAPTYYAFFLKVGGQIANHEQFRRPWPRFRCLCTPHTNFGRPTSLGWERQNSRWNFILYYSWRSTYHLILSCLAD